MASVKDVGWLGFLARFRCRLPPGPVPRRLALARVGLPKRLLPTRRLPSYAQRAHGRPQPRTICTARLTSTPN